MADFLSSSAPNTKAPGNPLAALMIQVIEGFKYTLEIVPDTLLASVCLFALLLQSPSLIAFALSLLSVNLIQPVVANFFKEIVPSGWALFSKATGKFPGASVERIMLSNTPTKGEIPSYYTMFIGTLIGWLSPLPLFYKSELNISPNRILAATVSLCFLLLFSLILLSYRFLASQDTVMGIILGVGVGSIFGFGLFIGLYYATQRRITNLYNFPLLTTTYGGKDPIYVCATK